MKKKIITIVFAIILIFIIFTGLDLYATKNIEFSFKNSSNFNVQNLSFDFTLSVCNPTFMITSFDKIDAHLFHKFTKIGTATISGKQLPPFTSTDVFGHFDIDGLNVAKVAVGGFLSKIFGQTSEINEDDLKIQLRFEKKILQMIPFSHSHYYTMEEFLSQNEQSKKCA